LITVSSYRRNGIWYAAAINDQRLLACAFSDRSRREAERSMRKSLPSDLGRQIRRSRDRGQTLRMLTTYYDGNGKKANPRTLDLSHVSDFRRNVYKALCEIPLGKVTTYGAIAEKVGGKRYARAVGTAVATNPLPLIVPCHRVVPSSLRVGNYGMGGRNPSTGGYMKRRLLEREGVKFQGDKVSKGSTWISP